MVRIEFGGYVWDFVEFGYSRLRLRIGLGLMLMLMLILMLRDEGFYRFVG